MMVHSLLVTCNWHQEFTIRSGPCWAFSTGTIGGSLGYWLARSRDTTTSSKQFETGSWMLSKIPESNGAMYKENEPQKFVTDFQPHPQAVHCSKCVQGVREQRLGLDWVSPQWSPHHLALLHPTGGLQDYGSGWQARSDQYQLLVAGDSVSCRRPRWDPQYKEQPSHRNDR